MHVIKLFLLLPAVFALNLLSAQDIHFTQYNMSPMTLNPANIGAFNGTVRIGGIYRDQWLSIIGSSRFTTPSLWVDAPIIRGFGKHDWIGIGGMFFSDKAGSGGLVHGAFKFGAAYHLALDKKGDTYFTLGGNYGSENRSVDYTKFTFEDGWLDAKNHGGNYGNSLDYKSSEPTVKSNYTDLDVGLKFTTKLSKTADLTLGASMYHLLRPRYSILPSGGTGGTGNTDDPQNIPRRLIVHGTFNTEMSKQLSFSPSFLFQSMGGGQEIMLQAPFGYKLDPKKDLILRAGLGYRLGDALALLLGFSKGPWNVGLAYDFNISDLTTVSRYQGGFELAANYILKIYKPPVVRAKVLCPRY